MATLWQIITSNSKLAVQAGTNFWDHLTNQNDGIGNGNGDVFVGAGLTAEIKQEMSADVGVSLSANLTDVELTATIAENLSANIEQDLN